MPRPMGGRGRIHKPGTCPACGHRFGPDDHVLLDRCDVVICVEHRRLLVADAIVAEGRYAVLRRPPTDQPRRA